MSEQMPESVGFRRYDCITCWDRNSEGLDRLLRPMLVCPDCGNKRCPKATDHLLDCTGSNEPGQPGSWY